MAEEYVINDSYIFSKTASPSELTRLVSDGDLRARIASTASVLGWEKIGSSSDDDIDQGVSYFVYCKALNDQVLCRSRSNPHRQR